MTKDSTTHIFDDFEIFSFERDVEAALAKLELPDGPKVTRDHVEEISSLWYLGEPDLVIFRSKSDAAAAKKLLSKCASKTTQLLYEYRQLRDISDEMSEKIDSASPFAFISSSDEDDGMVVIDTNEKPSLDAVLEKLNRLFEAGHRSIERYMHKEWPGKGRGADRYPRKVALSVAKIYIELRNGEKPKYGVDGIRGEEPATLYTRVVHRIFKALEIDTSFRSPCQHVVNKIKAGEFPPAD